MRRELRRICRGSQVIRRLAVVLAGGTLLAACGGGPSASNGSGTNTTSADATSSTATTTGNTGITGTSTSSTARGTSGSVAGLEITFVAGPHASASVNQNWPAAASAVQGAAAAGGFPVVTWLEGNTLQVLFPGSTSSPHVAVVASAVAGTDGDTPGAIEPLDTEHFSLVSGVQSGDGFPPSGQEGTVAFGYMSPSLNVSDFAAAITPGLTAHGCSEPIVLILSVGERRELEVVGLGCHSAAATSFLMAAVAEKTSHTPTQISVETFEVS